MRLQTSDMNQTTNHESPSVTSTVTPTMQKTRGQCVWVRAVAAIGAMKRLLLFLVMVSVIMSAVRAAGLPADGELRPDSEEHMRLLRDVLSSSSQTFRAVARKARPAVVSIRCRSQSKAVDVSSDAPPAVVKDGGLSLGSGVLIDANGYILTSYHVVAYASSITVQLADRREFAAQLLSFDPETDLAMLHIDVSEAPFAVLGDSDRSEVGDWVLAIGSPFGLDQTVTAGIISAKQRELFDDTDEMYGAVSYIQTDAAINPGSSGGPLLNMYGEVIAISHATLGNQMGSNGLAFATPINLAKAVLESMKNGQGTPRGRLGAGLADMTQDMAKAIGLEKIAGAQVTFVKRGSAAATAGIETGDVIIKVGGVVVEDRAHLRSLVSCQAVDQDVAFMLFRKGKEQEVVVRLTPKRLVAHDPLLQMAVVDLVKVIADKLGLQSPEGVLILAVAPNGLGVKAGLRPGMVVTYVNGMPTPDCRKYLKVMEHIAKNRIKALELAINVKGELHTVRLQAHAETE